MISGEIKNQMNKRNLNQHIKFGVKPMTYVMAARWILSTRCHDLGVVGLRRLQAAK